MEQLRNISSRQSGADKMVRKDKLEQTKIRERQIKEAHKQELQAAKASKQEARLAEAEAFRTERSWNPVSKRAAKDARMAERQERKRQEGFTCEHGIYKCRICQPVVKHK